MVKEHIYTTYVDYIQNDYLEYQKKFFHNITERDKVLLKLLQQHISLSCHDDKLSILDIGCSTGNFISHMKNLFTNFSYTGTDAYPKIIKKCESTAELNDVCFYVQDIRTTPSRNKHDVVIANAVLQAFETEELIAALNNIYTSLRQGGIFAGLSWWHKYRQELFIVETSEIHGGGNPLCIRSFESGNTLFKQAGFSSVDFFPFELPFDIPEPPDNVGTATYTVRTERDTRLQFRGSICQPWCHFVARKP